MGIWNPIQNRVASVIRKYGTSSTVTATLKRGTTSRAVDIVILGEVNYERKGNNLLQWTDKRVIISPKGLTIPPDNEQDVLVIDGVEHRIIQPASVIQPDGKTSIYWEVFVRTVDQP